MSLFTQTEKISTAQAILVEYNKIVASLGSAKAGFDYLTTQVEAMTTSGNFTTDEIAEVQALQVTIIDLAKSLLPTE